ncbi:MAG: 2Fe-2S iron-sulfur cluster binding domain-containing protein, partial [Lachnospiraceae bacterium]|nr:2Fe-2S iron-sulfur cluster binding domain-containing protein [Lachnospiraceae bacterium]
MKKVTFKFSNAPDVETYANEGEKLLDVAKKANVVIDAPCSGNASCGKCIVKIVSGTVESSLTRHFTEKEYRSGFRLACNSKIVDDVVVMVPDIASAFKKRMKISDLSSEEELKIFRTTQERIAATGLKNENDFRILELQLSEPTIEDTMPDNERLYRAVAKEAGNDKIRISYNIMRKLPLVLRENEWHVKVLISTEDEHIIVNDVIPHDKLLYVTGLAVDIGTTTVSAVLFDMISGKFLARGAMGNGQIRYGADVINRIIEATKEGGSKKLKDAVLKETINPLIREMCASAGISRDFIYRMCVAGNTTMNHLFAGIYSEYIRMEPYIPEFFQT